MGAKKGSPEATRAGSKIPEVDDTSEERSSYFSSKRISSSSYDNQPTAVKDAKGKIPQPRLADLEKNGVYDREAILHYLANLTRLGGGYEIFKDIPLLNKGSTNSKNKISNRLSEIDKDDKLTVEERHYLLVDEMRETLKAVPDSLLHVWTGWVSPGDSGVPADRKPDWLDMDKLKRGQQFAKDNMFAALYVTMEGCIPLYSFEDSLKPMIFTGNTTKPSVAFKRYILELLYSYSWIDL